MRLTFCLRNLAAKNATPVYAYIHWTVDGRHYQWKLATGVKVEPKQWNQTRRRIKRGAIGEAIGNARLGDIEADMHRLFAEMEATSTTPTPDVVRKRYEALCGGAKILKAPEFFDTYEQFIANNTSFTDGTKKNHRASLNTLRAFATTYDLAVTFDRFDVVLWERFVRYLLTVRQITNESAWSVVKSIKAFLADSFDKRLHRNESFTRVTRRRLLPKSDSTDHVFLTPAELAKVEAKDFSRCERLARVRDLFVFLCYTGLRFHDAQRLEPCHRHGDTLKFTTGKNRKAVTTPLHPKAAAILDRYNGRLPRISNQRANIYLAEVLAAAKLSEPVQVVRYRGTERVERTEPKYEVVGMHGAKRTFVTLALLRGTSAEALAMVTGNTPATLRLYDVRTSAEAMEEVRGAWERFE